MFPKVLPRDDIREDILGFNQKDTEDECERANKTRVYPRPFVLDELSLALYSPRLYYLRALVPLSFTLLF